MGLVPLICAQRFWIRVELAALFAQQPAAVQQQMLLIAQQQAAHAQQQAAAAPGTETADDTASGATEI